MASTSTKATTTKSILKPVTSLKGHGDRILSISYFPDGQRMISGSLDKTTWQWDLKAGREIEGARDVGEAMAWAVEVSKDGRWFVTGGGDYEHSELKACEVETGIVKIFKGHSRDIHCIDISAGNTLLASESMDDTARIWNLETGKIMAGPFACNSWCMSHDYAKTIYEFDAVTLETIAAAPFEGHTKNISGLALSFDDALLVSASSQDNTIKLWAFESRQLLAFFDVQNPVRLVLSPDSRQLAYVSSTKDDSKICICDTPPDILAQARVIIAHKKSARRDLLNFDPTRRPPAGHRRPPISAIRIAPIHPPARDPKQPTFLRLSKFQSFSPRAHAVPICRIQPPHPLDIEIASPPRRSNGITQFLRWGISFHRSGTQHELPVVEVAAGRKFARLAAAKLPEYRKVNDTRHPSRQQTTGPQDDPSPDSSDVDSLPDVHWFKALFLVLVSRQTKDAFAMALGAC
ncbi:WD40 repeat-like protein [Suillus weaverae]|nr:WD40 repeat-like protein [Suillus weaverae]